MKVMLEWHRIVQQGVQPDLLDTLGLASEIREEHRQMEYRGNIRQNWSFRLFQVEYPFRVCWFSMIRK